MEVEREPASAEEGEARTEEAAEDAEGERDWFQSTRPTPGPGDSDGGGSD